MPIITMQKYVNLYEDESGELYDVIIDLKKGWTYKFDQPYKEEDPERDLLGRLRLEPVVIPAQVLFDEEEELFEAEIDEDGYVNDLWQTLEDVNIHFEVIPHVLELAGRVNTNFGLLPCLNCLFYGFTHMPEIFERCETCQFLPQIIELEDHILKVGTWTWSSYSRCDTYEDPCNPGEEYDESLYDDCDFPYNNRRRELFPEPGLDDRDYWSDNYNDNQSV